MSQLPAQALENRSQDQKLPKNRCPRGQSIARLGLGFSWPSSATAAVVHRLALKSLMPDSRSSRAKRRDNVGCFEKIFGVSTTSTKHLPRFGLLEQLVRIQIMMGWGLRGTEFQHIPGLAKTCFKGACPRWSLQRAMRPCNQVPAVC